MREIHTSEVDLNLLVALDALLQERSVSRAAALLGLTQSAMSHRLRRLRERFGDELLVGGRGGMIPTPRAEELAQPIRRGLLELGEVLREPEAFDPATSTRRFTMITRDYAELVVAPRVLEQMGTEAPNVELVLRPPSDATIDQLARGDADIYVGIPVDADLVRLSAARDDFVTVVRIDHPAVGRTLDLDTYCALGHVLVGQGDGPSFIDTILARLGRKRRIVLRIGHFGGAPFVAARSDLVATLPRAVAITAARYLPVRVLEPPIELPPIPIEVMWHARSNLDGGHRWLRTLVSDTTRAAVGEVLGKPDRTGRAASPRSRAPRRAR